MTHSRDDGDFEQSPVSASQAAPGPGSTWTEPSLASFLPGSEEPPDQAGPVPAAGPWAQPGSEPQSYGGPQSYGEPQGYAAPQNYGGPQNYGEPQGYAAPQNYGGPQSYGGPYSHAEPQDHSFVPDAPQPQYPIPPQQFDAPQQFAPGPPMPPTPPATQEPAVGEPSVASASPVAPSVAQPAPVPAPEELLSPRQDRRVAEPARWGWRGRLNRASLGLLKPKAGEKEVAARRSAIAVQRSFSRPMTVVVVQPKGGAGKTPTTICLSAAFGAHRGGYVVGWDDNETRGTLAVRVANPDGQRATVWDLLSDLPDFERLDARVGDLGYYVRSQPEAHFDALVSDDNPANMAQIGEDEFHRIHQVLQRFYRLIVVDTGNNVRSPNWQAAVNAADLIVVVSTYQRDVGYSGSWVLDHLAQTGREELARNAVTVLTAADPTTDKTVRSQLLDHFGARTRAVIEIPYDPELAHGGPIRWTQLAPQTRTAWTQAGATVVGALAEHDQRGLAARRA